MYRYYNPNPHHRITGDCVVRAISKALGMSWVKAFNVLSEKALTMSDMPSCNKVWTALLHNYGFKQIPITEIMTVSEFAERNRIGVFVAGTGEHVVAIINGDYYDTWDSGNEEIMIIFKGN